MPAGLFSCSRSRGRRRVPAVGPCLESAGLSRTVECVNGNFLASFRHRRSRRDVAARQEGRPDGTPTRASRGRGIDVFLLAVVLGGLIAGALVRPVFRGGEVSLRFAGYRFPTICWFRLATGMPCPSCGLTRAVVLLLHGRWAESLAAHPFGVPVLALILLAIPPRVAAVLAAGRAWVAKWDRAWGFAIAAVLLCMLSWWAFRIGLAIASSR